MLYFVTIFSCIVQLVTYILIATVSCLTSGCIADKLLFIKHSLKFIYFLVLQVRTFWH